MNFANFLRTSFQQNPSGPANISCFPRSLEDVLKTSSRRLQDVFVICLPKMSSRRLQDVFKTSSKTSSRRVCKTSCNYVFKTSWKTKKCYTEDVFKTSSRRLQYVFTKTNVCWGVTASGLNVLAKIGNQNSSI